MPKKNSMEEDPKFRSPNDYLNLEKGHKDWYSPHYQGKSRGRPWVGAEPEKKKEKTKSKKKKAK